MLKTVLSDYMTGLLALYKTQSSLESQEAFLVLKKMVASALSYIPHLPGKENISLEISGITGSSETGFPVIPTMRLWDRKSKIYGYIHVLHPHQELDLKLNRILPEFKRMYPHVIYTNLFEFFPFQGERVRNKVRPFRLTTAKGISDDFKVQAIRVFLRSLESFLRWRSPIYQSASFFEMQRQLALKTFFLRQYLLKPLLVGNDNQTLLRGGQGKRKKLRRLEGRKLRRMKASKPCLHNNSNALYDYRHFVGFSADSVHLKKPSGGSKGLIGPPCHGAPGRRRQNDLPKIYRNYCDFFQETLSEDDFSGFLAHVIMDGFIKACILHHTLHKEDRMDFSRSVLAEYARFNGMPSRRMDLFQWLSSAGNLMPESLQWVLDDIAWWLSEFDFKQMGFETTNPGAIPGEQLQWDEYFFVPYYDNPKHSGRIKLLLKSEGTFDGENLVKSSKS